MLQMFRSGLTSYFATALLGLLIASFALWGIGGDILGGAGNNVAQIGDEKLSLNDYAKEFQSKFTEIQQQSNGVATRAMVVDQGLATQWVNELVQRETFAYAAHDLNIRVTDNQLREFIMGIEAFQDTFGEFSKANFENIAGFRGYTPGEFEEILRRDLERQNLMTSIISGISIPDAVEKTFLKYITEERTAEIVTIPTSAITDIPAADEETLLKFYNDSSANYMAPEYRDFRFIILATKDFMGDITVTDEEIEEIMGNPAAGTAGNEQRDFEQILFEDKESADKAYSDLEAGRAFSDIIIASGSTAEEALVTDHNMQDVTDTYGLSSAEAIFTTDEGKYTAPVETDFGWRIFNVAKSEKPVDDKETLQAEAIKTLKEEKALDLLYTKSELINDELAAGASLSDIAESLSLELKEAHDIDRSGYNSKGDLVTNIPTDPTFLSTVFQALEMDEPVLEELESGEYYIFMVDNIQETTLRPFDEVKTSVADIWTTKTRRDMAQAKATEIQLASQDDISLKDLAAQSADYPFISVTLTRNDQTGKVSQDIQRSIFSLNTGDAEVITASDGNGFVVVKLISRKLPDNADLQIGNSQLKGFLKREYEQRFLANYWRHLEASLPVIINQRGVNAVHEQLASREQ